MVTSTTPQRLISQQDTKIPENLLIVLVGLTPAILTETVWALAEEGPSSFPDRIIVITTLPGKERLCRELFDLGGWEELNRSLKRACPPLDTNHIRFGPIADCIRVIPSQERDREMLDIRSNEDNLAVAEFLMETLRGFCQGNDIRITASLAGGRKTVGALLHNVMTLLGRHHDRIVHVLVNDPWERIPEFRFPGSPGDFKHPDTGESLSSNTAKLELAEVPFLPLRYLFEKEINRSAGSFTRLMRNLRQRIQGWNDELELALCLATGSLKINHISIPLNPLEFAFYAVFTLRAKNVEGSLPNYLDLQPLIETLARQQHNCRPEGHWSHVVLEKTFDTGEDARKWASRIRKCLASLGFDNPQIERLVPIRGRLSIDLSPHSITIKN